MMSTQVNGTAVRHYPQTVFVPEVDPSRPAFGLPENDILFITSFELLSDMNRKNTGAVIESFRQAFPGKEGVGLVVNVNNPHPHPAASEQLRELHSRASNDPRIVLIEKNLTYREVLSLYAACDAIVSLHRGEGLGLSPMEGMTLGKPVIATAWSGVMDFMSDRNSCLVPCTLVPLPAASASGYNASYVGGATVWAEPDVGCAAVWMRRLAEDASLRKKIGDAAAGDLRQRHQLCGKGETFHEVELFCENIDRFRENGPVTMPRDSGEKDPDGFSGIGDFIRKILSLVEERRIGEALEYYERRRAIIGSGKASPELMRIDDLLKKLGASGLFSR